MTDEIKNLITSLPVALSGDLIFDLRKTMAKNKRWNAYNYILKSAPYMLGEEHKELFEKARRLIETEWQTKLEEVGDDLELKIISELDKVYWEKFKAEKGYDEKEIDALLNEMRKISPYRPTPPELRAVPVP
jgi:hypothetical protein